MSKFKIAFYDAFTPLIFPFSPVEDNLLFVTLHLASYRLFSAVLKLDVIGFKNISALKLFRIRIAHHKREQTIQ